MKRINFRGGGMDMGNTTNRATSASMGNTTSRSRNTGTGTRSNPHTSSGTSNTSTVSGNTLRSSRQNFIDSVNRNNQGRAAQSNTRFTPYQGGSRPTATPFQGLGGLMKTALGFAFPGAGFLFNQGSALKDGIMNLNNRLQNSDFGQATSLMDYLDMRKFGGLREREDKAAQTMAQARGIQKNMVDRPSATMSPRDYAMAGLEPVDPVNETYTFEDIATVAPVPPGEQIVPQSKPEISYDYTNFGFPNYGSAEAAVPDSMIAKTPVEEFRDQTYKNIAEGTNTFVDSLYNPQEIAALENLYADRYNIANTSGGIISDARHMAAMNNLSNTLSPFNNRFGNFIGDVGAFTAGAINEIPALFRGLNKQNLGEIGEDLVANYRGSFGTPNQTTAEQIYQDEFDSYNNNGIATLFSQR